MNGEHIFMRVFCDALNQYTTVTSVHVLCEIICASIQPMISAEIQNAEKYIPSGYVIKLKFYF